MEQSRFDVAALIGEVVDDFRPLIDSMRQAVQVEAPVGQLMLVGDRRRVHQVLTNLIANAIKFAPPGGVIAVRAAARGHWSEIQVEDNGPGIDADVLPKLFQRYVRAPGSSAGGTGLGLLIVREIVEAHGGSVGVESTPGKGTRFWVRLPAAEAARPLEPPVAAPIG